jgi:putative Holliday junction resolvase
MQIVDTPAELIQALAPNTRLMGVDLGSKTLGLALGDSQHKIATPFFTLRRKKFGPDAAALAKILADEKVGGMVMGLPLNMDGSAGPRVQATQAFLRNLTNLGDFPALPVLLWDERLSTAAVERTLLEADTFTGYKARRNLARTSLPDLPLTCPLTYPQSAASVSQKLDPRLY